MNVYGEASSSTSYSTTDSPRKKCATFPKETTEVRAIISQRALWIGRGVSNSSGSSRSAWVMNHRRTFVIKGIRISSRAFLCTKKKRERGRRRTSRVSIPDRFADTSVTRGSRIRRRERTRRFLESPITAVSTRTREKARPADDDDGSLTQRRFAHV